MSDDRGEARSDPGLGTVEEPAAEALKPTARPPGLPDAKSAARRRTPVSDEADPRDEEASAGALRSLRPSRDPDVSPRQPDARPPGLTQMTTSARQRLQLVLEQDDDDGPPRVSTPPAPDPTRPPRLTPAQIALGPTELRVVRSLARWVAFSGLMTLTVGALTGLSYFTGEGKVAHVVVGILASALSVWLLGAALSFHRVAGRTSRPRHSLVTGFGLLRSALLLKALLVFAAMALGCFTFSLAASFLFLL